MRVPHACETVSGMSMRDFRTHISQDWNANRGLPKSLLVLTSFRMVGWLKAHRSGAGWIAYPLAAGVYKVTVEWVLGIEIPASTSIGPGLRLRHGVGTVVNPAARLGNDVLLRHGVTIGNRNTRDKTACPNIGDSVEIGANAIILGPIRIGDRARIGAGTVVMFDVDADATVIAAAAEVRGANTLNERAELR